MAITRLFNATHIPPGCCICCTWILWASHREYYPTDAFLDAIHTIFRMLRLYRHCVTFVNFLNAFWGAYVFDVLEYPIPIIPPWPLRDSWMLLTSHPDVYMLHLNSVSVPSGVLSHRGLSGCYSHNFRMLCLHRHCVTFVNFLNAFWGTYVFGVLEHPIPIMPPWPLRGSWMLLTPHPDVLYVTPEFCEHPIGSIIPPRPF